MDAPLTHIAVDPQALKTISSQQAWHYRIIPLVENGLTRRFLLSDEMNESEVAQQLEVQFDCKVHLEPTPHARIEQLLGEHYKRTYSNASARQYDIRQSEDFLDMLIEEAKSLGSSDIHIECYEEKARVRIRIDGTLVERYVLDKLDYPVLINKIKIKARLDIAEKRLPQDGRITFKRYGSDFDMRVSVLPTLHAEKVVLRLLNKDATDIDIRTLGMSEHEALRYAEGYRRPNGIILISGPTGSGKTTTLYATLKVLNQVERNIMTIEDPIEYTLEGINQVQLKENIGLTFASALKSFLRQDPDVIMLGEIRDKQTAEMAIRAALTGHLVLSTIHTNSSWGTISRLQDMGIPSFLISSTLNTSVAQRLVRLLCEGCKRSVDVINVSFPAGYELPRAIGRLFEAVGCDQCYHTGYRGRRAVYEVLPIDGQAVEAMKRGEELGNEALREMGVSCLSDNAFAILAEGKTSIDEVYPLLMNH